jgi:hypothetical protein
MRVTLIALLFAGSAFAQDQSAVAGAACGPQGVSFNVKHDDSPHTLAQPEPGKALIYFIQETGAANCLGTCVTKIGLDGAWVGAFKHNSYFSVTVDPGEHHACMNLQSSTPLGKLVAFVHVTAEAGKVYYLATQAVVKGNTTRLEIDPIDSDQAKYLIASSPLSVSQPRK